MGSFGENLRREREMRGVSLQEICDATKISVRMLKAMEADQFDKLPGGIFTRSFVRAYIRYLGLDEEAIMAELQLAAPSAAQPTDLGRMNQQHPAKETKRSLAGLLAVLVVLLVIAGGYAYYHFERRQVKARPSAAQTVPPPASATSPATTPSQPAEFSTAPGGAAAAASGQPGAANASQAVPVAATASSSGAANGLVLQVAATEESWVAVECDGKPATQRTMQPNEIQTFRARSSFDLITGNAEGVILTLNGKTLDPLGHRGETKKVHLTIKDVQGAAP
jgi:cytoskeleton protein RodZ